MNTQELQQTLELIRKAQATPMGDPRLDNLGKSTFAQSASATSGLTFYDLELGAKLLYPVLTPLRNSIPRVSGKGGIQAAWRAITGINSNGLRVGVSGGNRGGVMAVTTADYTAAYKGIGIESNVDFEAQYAGQGFDDVRALAAKTGLEALMLGEESMLLGGNTSVALGTTPTGTLVSNMPVLLFCIAFGLSMDYEVFLVSRIREFWLASPQTSADNDESVALGLAHTGRVITAAALIMAISFAALIAAKVAVMRLFGVGLTLAVLVDATLVRLVLVPAFMGVMGKWNWWAPAPLRAFHRRFGISESGETDGILRT